LKTPLLAELLAEDDVAVVSLRESLSWVANIPASLPLSRTGNRSDTIVVGGLDTILEVLPPADSELFLSLEVRPVISMMQEYFDNVGLVFGLNIRPESLRVDHEDHVLFNKSSEERVRLSSSLWNGAAGSDLAELQVSDLARQQGMTEGYYVNRLS
jgi:hypothetical protein